MPSETLHERMKGWFARILLALIIVSFALFGVDTYFKAGGSGQWIAEVGKERISRLEFDERLKQAQAQLLARGEKAAALDREKLRDRVLEELIRERLLYQAARARGYDVSEEVLWPELLANPVFQEGGRFSERRFEEFLRSNRMTRAEFFEALKRERLVQMVLAAPISSVIVPKSVAERLAEALAEEREVSRVILAPEDFASRVQVTPAEIEARYRAHPERFTLPEGVVAEYVVFSPERLAQNLVISEEEARAYYQRHMQEFAEPETREARHILLRLAPGASPEQRAQVMARARALLEQAKGEPASFGELARRHSEDPTSAREGGRLPPVTPGSLFPALEKVVMSLAPGEIGGPVETPAGVHLVKLESVTPARPRPFESVQAEVLERAKRERAMQRFSEEADKFSDLVYAKPESLAPVAEAYGLKIERSPWIPRTGVAPGLFANENLRAALFSSEVVAEGRNTEAVEVDATTLVAARVVEHRPAGLRPLAEVRAEIEAELEREKAARLAREQGEAWLRALEKGEAPKGLSFPPPVVVGRGGSSDFTPEEMRAVFSSPAQTLPTHLGVARTGGSFVVLRVTARRLSEARLQQAKLLAPMLLERAASQALASAFVESLRRETAPTVRQAFLEQASR